MKKTLLALGTTLLMAAGSASAQTYYYDYGYRNDPYYATYDSDRDGVQDRYDRYDNRYDRYDSRYDRYEYRYPVYSTTTYPRGSRYTTYSGDRDCDGVPNRYDRYDSYDRQRYDRDCDGVPNRFDRVDNRTYRARYSYSSPSRYAYPYGYTYGTTYSVGSYLPRGYYGSSYYIDYRPYGLSAPPYGYQWVRVGNDVYMVRTSNGLINEIVYSLFH
jgi:Ni/Co efflux regulator RcnB